MGMETEVTETQRDWARAATAASNKLPRVLGVRVSGMIGARKIGLVVGAFNVVETKSSLTSREMSDTGKSIRLAIGKVFYSGSRADDPGPWAGSGHVPPTPAPGRILGPEDHYASL